ncbi:MAG: hypothetical protein ACREBO_12835 [Novosphingobium sp.]
MTRQILVLTIAAMLAGCAGSAGDYPSLARRPVERISGTAPVAAPDPAPAPPAPLSPELAARLTQLGNRVVAAHGKFTAREARARSLVGAAGGAAIASERWAVATVALAELESARSEAMIALADLDALYAAARIAGEEAGVIGETRTRVLAVIGREDEVLAELRGRIAG